MVHPLPPPPPYTHVGLHLSPIYTEDMVDIHGFHVLHKSDLSTGQPPAKVAGKGRRVKQSLCLIFSAVYALSVLVKLILFDHNMQV